MMLTKKPEINTILQATPDPHSLPLCNGDRGFARILWGQSCN